MYGPPVTRLRASNAVMASAGLLLAGCVFFLPSEPLGSTCHFAGETQSCGACIARACQPKVDTCCGDSSCKLITLDELDRCAQGNPCGTFASATSTSTGARSELGRCIATECASECDLSTSSTSSSSSGGSTKPRVDCEKHPSLPFCSCEAKSGDASASQGSCAPSDVSATRNVTCCASTSWPSVGSTCECGEFVCDTSQRTGCSCSWGAQGTGVEPSSGCSEGTPSYEWECCAQGRSCYCFQDQGIPRCTSGFTSSPPCTPQEIPCPSGKKHVSTCSN